MAFADPKVLLELVRRHRSGEPAGIYSVCSANRFVLEAAVQQAAKDGTYLLIEATCNQVNQSGGYSGLTPPEFAEMIKQIVATMGFPKERVLLGGDHLGPFPWQKLPAQQAMARAIEMIEAYVQAGFCKLHLDASMPCADDRNAEFGPDLVAERAALLCLAAERTLFARPDLSEPVYVIGTEVPPPGGAQNRETGLTVTNPTQVEETLASFKRTFYRLGLEKAWDRVIAMVVQPGVDFGNEELFSYDRRTAAGLSRFIEQTPGLVYEAHSTDYQKPESLKAMVEDHFAILKVGPALTFALRETLFALARIEDEWLKGRIGVQLSDLIETVDAAMMRNPAHWEQYYRGNLHQVMLARKYSRSDRIRYYWSDPSVVKALRRLFTNLDHLPAPSALLSQYLPTQYRHLQAGLVENKPDQLIHDHIMEVLQDYSMACMPGINDKTLQPT